MNCLSWLIGAKGAQPITPPTIAAVDPPLLERPEDGGEGKTDGPGDTLSAFGAPAS